MREALIAAKFVPAIPSNELNAQSLSDLIKALEANFPDKVSLE